MAEGIYGPQPRLVQRRMETQKLIDRVYDHVEAGEVDKAVIACLRLARKMKDVFNVIIFLRELRPDTNQLQQSFFQETQHLNQEARKGLWKITQDSWIQERTLNNSLHPEDEDRKVLALGVGQLRREIEQMEKSIEDLRLPEGMGEFDIAAFTDRNRGLKSEARLKIQACNDILERVRTRCLNYASRIEGQLEVESKTTSLISSLQSEVHNYYAAQCDSVYQSLRSASSLIGSANSENHALVLTSIRRAMKAAADFHYPPVADPVVCRDGKTRTLGEEQYLNRLQEFCAQKFGTDTSAHLLQAEVEVFSSFVRKLHEVASKGVHAQVSPTEARQGLIGAYMLLSNLIAKLNEAGE